MTKIYKPTIISEDPLDLEQSKISYNKNLFEGTENGFIKMDVDKDVAIQRMSRDLYQHASSGFRELYANEARACRYAKKHHNAEPLILITLDPQKQKLVIEGIDSTGMTSERFKKVFTVLGHSDNFDGQEVGQFGMGRAAYTCLSDTIILETFARESNEKYAVLGRNGLGYQIIDEPKMDTYGTKISLTLYGEINYESLYAMIEKVSKFSQVKTVLVLESKIQIKYGQKEAGQYVMGPVSYEQALKELEGNKEDQLRIPISLEDESLRIDGCINISKRWDGTNEIYHGYESLFETYLVNVPIATKILSPLSHGILTIKDERKFQPTPDRERLKESTEEQVKTLVHRLLSRESGLNIATLEEFYNGKNRMLYECLSERRYDSDDRIMSILDERTKNLIKLLECEVWSTDKTKHALVSLLEKPSKIFHVEKLEKSKIAALQQDSPGCLIFRPIKPDVATMELFSSFGILSAQKYLDENKIQVKRITTKMTQCVEHHSTVSYDQYKSNVALHSSKVLFADVGEKTIRADKEFQMVKNTFKNAVCSYKTVKDKADIKGGIAFSDFVTGIESKTYPTSSGNILPKDIARYPDITLFEYDNRNLAPALETREDSILVISDADELFEIAVYLSYKNIPYNFVKEQSRSSGENCFDVGEMINKYGKTRDVTVHTDDYIIPYYNHADDIPKLMSILDGIMTISNEKMLHLFLDATKKNKRYDNSEMQNKLPFIQSHLAAAREISKRLST